MSIQGVSADYIEVSEAEAKALPYSDAWRDPSIPGQQLELTDDELRRWFNFEPIAPFDVLKAILYPIYRGSLLEIGCGVGHNAEVIEQVGEFAYTGVDYSREFVKVARARRHRFLFDVMDAQALDYPARHFDIAISSCVLLHIVDWRTALKEAARVALRYLILHRTPIADTTRYFFKKAYGVQCVEIHFDEAEILAECSSHGFALSQSVPVTTDQKTYLFESKLMHHSV